MHTTASAGPFKEQRGKHEIEYFGADFEASQRHRCRICSSCGLFEWIVSIGGSINFGIDYSAGFCMNARAYVFVLCSALDSTSIFNI